MIDRIWSERVFSSSGSATNAASPTTSGNEAALEQTLDSGLDLIEIAPNGRPPVCKMVDYGKLKYEKKKKQQQSKKKQHVIKIKEIRLRPRIDDHDLMTKLNQGKAPDKKSIEMK